MGIGSVHAMLCARLCSRNNKSAGLGKAQVHFMPHAFLLSHLITSSFILITHNNRHTTPMSLYSVLDFGPSSLHDASGEEPHIQELLDVFAVFKKHRLTLRTFLERIINCENEQVKRHVGLFYSNGGPSYITKLWMERRLSDTELTNVAVARVLFQVCCMRWMEHSFIASSSLCYY